MVERVTPLTPQYVGREHPYKILVFSKPGACYMIRLKPYDKTPGLTGLTAIFNITYQSRYGKARGHLKTKDVL